MKFLKIISSLILFLLTLEALSWTWIKIQNSAPQKKWKVEWKRLRPADNIKHPGLEALFPGSLTSQTITSRDGLSTEILYSINEFGLRGPSPDQKKKKSHLLVSGDSYVFGQAIPESKTISSKLSRLHPDIRVSNLGWSAGGMHTALRLFELVNPKEYAPENEGTLIYVFLNFHVYRWLLRPRFIQWSPDYIPVFKEIDERFIFQGNLENLWQKKVFKLSMHSSFGKIVLDCLVDIGISYRKEDIHLYFNAVQELKRRYKEIYPQGRFVVVSHPLQDDYSFIPGAKEEAEARGIEFYDSIPEWKESHPEDNLTYLVPGDGHPKGEVNEFLSQFISRMILSSERPVKR